METHPLLETRNLKKYFKVSGGLLRAVDGISLRIERGQTLGVVGESGCGKTTLGRTILRLTEPTSGEILFDGKNIENLGKNKMKKMRHKMQIIFQDPYSSLDSRMSVCECIAEYLIYHRVYPRKQQSLNRASELMATVGLAQRYANSFPHELDGGRRQRIGVARALSLNPDFIVCDEPVSALDVSIQAQILNLLMDLQDNIGLTYMFITHDLSVVKHISNHIMVVYLGQCIEYAPVDELFANPLHPYTKALLAAIPVPDLSFRNIQREPIKGELKSSVNPVQGCRFAERCKYCSEKCMEPQVLVDIGNNHKVACCLVAERIGV